MKPKVPGPLASARPEAGSSRQTAEGKFCAKFPFFASKQRSDSTNRNRTDTLAEKLLFNQSLLNREQSIIAQFLDHLVFANAIERLGFDLTNALASDTEHFADFLEGVSDSVGKAETNVQNPSFSR